MAAMLLATGLLCHGKPARKNLTTYSQPDGTVFSAITRGDEWIKIRTLPDGSVITKSADGWWCYGIYDAEGVLTSSGYRVGHPAPSDILSSSRNIPYAALSEKAASRRSLVCRCAAIRREAIRRQMAKTRTGSGTELAKCLVILAEFKDQRFKYKKDDFEKLLNTQSGSAKEYYQTQFGSGWEFIFEVSSPVTLSGSAKYYGENYPTTEDEDRRPAEMVAEACELADGEIDFSKYDMDGDGEVDNVYIFYAGYDEAEFYDKPDVIWAHQWYVRDGAGIDCRCDGKAVNRYACSSELDYKDALSGIGTFCHEYGHTFGLPDLYDTDYDDDNSSGWFAAGTWSMTSLMDGGCYNNDSKTPPYFNCLERELLGLSAPEILQAGRTYTLDPIHKNGAYCKLETDREGEYFLFECRANEGWDRYIGGKGMLVYHIDRSSRYIGKWDEDNTVNADPAHQCADIIEADGRQDRLDYNADDPYGDIKGIFYPQSGVTAIPAEGRRPSLTFWSGDSPSISIAGITLTDGVISFNVIGDSQAPVIPIASNVTHTSFPDGALLRFESSDPATDAVPKVEWRPTGSSEAYVTGTADEYSDGKFACLMGNLKSGNVTYEVQITFAVDGISGSPYKFSVMTKKTPPVIWPYIHFDKEGFESSGSMPLYVINAGKAAQIQWTYNDTPVKGDGSHIFRPEGDGTLKATVTWKDGSNDIITKVIKTE